MPQLEWDETDVLTCLEVLPEIGDYETFYFYQVQQKDLQLQVEIWPCESVVEVSLLQQEDTITSWALAVRGGIRRVLDIAGERLEFCDCVIIANRFAYRDANPFDAALFPNNLTTKLSIKPHIRIAFA